MAFRLFETLFILPLLLVPAFSSAIDYGISDAVDPIEREFGFDPEMPLTDDKDPQVVIDGNDGGLAGNMGSMFDELDKRLGADIDFAEDPTDVQFMRTFKDDVKTDYLGLWEIVTQDSGVSAMHMLLLPNNKVLIFDSTDIGPSKIKLPAKSKCPVRPPAKEPDCWAHAVIYDIATAKTRPLHINTDPWCSSGGLGADGKVVSTGGFNRGSKSVRFIKPCDNCDWEDTPDVLRDGRWYASQVMLQDGSFIVVGGRGTFTYEFVPVDGKLSSKANFMPFLNETTDIDENNLYPFLHLLPDGNVFLFANSRSVLLEPKSNQIIREYPRLHGGSRNYPASGMSALLPLKLEDKQNTLSGKPEVIICGGARPEAFRKAEKEKVKSYLPALQDCARIKVMEVGAKWRIEQMPSRRVMGDMLILPTGDLLILNGALKGSSAWNCAKEPNFTPLLYSTYKTKDERFKALKPSGIARMYHSTAALMPDATILVGGSNTNPRYAFDKVEFPTELRMEKFSPHYLDPTLQKYRPIIVPESSDTKMSYGQTISIDFTIKALSVKATTRDLKVTMYAPPFTTHGWSMGQRLVQLGITDLAFDGSIQRLTALAPPASCIAPPGYYLAFVVYRSVPSTGIWVHIQ